MNDLDLEVLKKPGDLIEAKTVRGQVNLRYASPLETFQAIRKV